MRLDPEPTPGSALALLGRRSAEGAGSAGSPPRPWAGAGGALGTRCGLCAGWAGSRPQLRPLAPRAWTGFHEITDGERKESRQTREGPGQDRLVARSAEGRDLGAVCSQARGSARGALVRAGGLAEADTPFLFPPVCGSP